MGNCVGGARSLSAVIVRGTVDSQGVWLGSGCIGGRGGL